MWVRSLGWEDTPGEGHGNPLQYSCLENSMDRGAWQATVHRVAQSQTRLKQINTYKVPRIVKFIESESALVDAGSQGSG